MKFINLFSKIMLAAFFLSACNSYTSSSYSTWDDDNDGMLDNDEFTLALSEEGRYDDWDMNDDDLIDEDEWNEVSGDLMEIDDDAFDNWDIDRDEGIDENEFYDGIFTNYDRDRDDYFDEDEFNDWEDQWYE